MNYLDFNDLLLINTWGQNIVKNEITPTLGIREDNLLKSIPEAVKQSFGGVEVYPTIQDKAVYLWESLSKYHCFVDGNKRTSLLATIIFLKMNGYEIISKDHLYEVCIGLASNKITREYLKKYMDIVLESKSIPRERIAIENYLEECEHDKDLIKILSKLSK